MCLNTSNFSEVYTLQRGACTRRRGALRKCACISSNYGQALPLPDGVRIIFVLQGRHVLVRSPSSKSGTCGHGRFSIRNSTGEPHYYQGASPFHSPAGGPAVVCGRRSFSFKAKIDKVRPQNLQMYLDKIIMSARCAAQSPGSGCSCHLEVIVMRAFSVLTSFARSSVKCPKVQVFFAAAPCFLASNLFRNIPLSSCGLGYRTL